jgi:hypothetical protein
MALARSLSRRLRLPGRIALILGLGALSTAGAGADTPEQGKLTTPGDVVVRSEGGRVFLSEGGQETELGLSATPERARLLRLLEDHGPAGVKLDRDPRLIMSGGGGSGFSLRDIQRSILGEPAPAPRDAQQPGAPKRAPAGRESKPASDKKG